MPCKGICIRYKAKKLFGGGWYHDGSKRCTACDIFIKWDKARCPCCNGVLKLKPTKRKWKEKLKISMVPDSHSKRVKNP